MIKRSKNNDEMPDFDEVMNDVEQEVEADKAEQEIIDRVPQLQQFVKNVDLATNTFINSTLELENAINMYLHAEDKFQEALNTISGKVATINAHIDDVLKEAPTKLKVSVEVSSKDWQKIENMFDEHNKKILGMMQGNINKVNAMFADEREAVRKRYKEYDGVYLGRYAQWFVAFFFVIGFFVCCYVIVMLIAHGK
jgi:chromosome segregation ATPase